MRIMTEPIATPIPVGTVVDYNGSQAHGRYVITAHADPRKVVLPAEATDDILAWAYPDNTAYEIWPVELEKSFRNRDYAVIRVRRKSLTVVTGDAAS